MIDRERWTGWIWVGLVASVTLVVPVWVMISAVVLHLAPEGPPGLPLGGASLVGWAMGRAAWLLLQSALPLLLGLGAIVMVASMVGRRRAAQDRLRYDADVAEDAVLHVAELHVHAAAPRSLDALGAAESLDRDATADGTAEPVALSTPAPRAPAAAPPAPPPRPTRPVARLVAGMIDVALFAVAFSLQLVLVLMPPDVASGPRGPTLIIGLSVAAISIVLAAFVVQGLLVHRHQQTLGQRFVGVKVVNIRERRMSVSTQLLRTASFTTLALAVPLIGWIALLVDTIMMFQGDGRSLRDRVSGTRVVEAG